MRRHHSGYHADVTSIEKPGEREALQNEVGRVSSKKLEISEPEQEKQEGGQNDI